MAPSTWIIVALILGTLYLGVLRSAASKHLEPLARRVWYVLTVIELGFVLLHLLVWDQGVRGFWQRW